MKITKHSTFDPATPEAQQDKTGASAHTPWHVDIARKGMVRDCNDTIIAEGLSPDIAKLLAAAPETAAERDSLKWQLGEADGMYDMVKREREQAREQVKTLLTELNKACDLLDRHEIEIPTSVLYARASVESEEAK